jgi:hypothetical protein
MKTIARHNVLPFPALPGSPGDPNVDVFKQAFAEIGKSMTDADARKFARDFEAARKRHDLETDHLMTSAERADYTLGKMAEKLNKLPRQDGLPSLPVSKQKIARIFEDFQRRDIA